MLRKLMKYELRAALRVFGYIWLGVVLMTGLEYLIFSFDMDHPLAVIVAVVTMFPYALALIALSVLPTIYFALRFYRGLLGREGYLMFTLPTEPWKLLTAKLLTALIITTVSTLVTLGGLAVLVLVLLNEGGMDLRMIFGSISFSWDILWVILSFFATQLCSLLMIYMACCLGHMFRTRRGIWAVAIFYGMNMMYSIMTVISQRLSFAAEEIGTFIDPQGLLGSVMLPTLPLNVGLSILFFFLCERILRNKLNLE
jgi:hypothetical protein